MSKTKRFFLLGSATVFLFLIMPFFVVQAKEENIPLNNIPPDDQCCFYSIGYSEGIYEAGCAHSNTSIAREKCIGGDDDMQYGLLRCGSVLGKSSFEVKVKKKVGFSYDEFDGTLKFLDDPTCLYDNNQNDQKGEFDYGQKKKLGIIEETDIKGIGKDDYCCLYSTNAVPPKLFSIAGFEGFDIVHQSIIKNQNECYGGFFVRGFVWDKCENIINVNETNVKDFFNKHSRLPNYFHTSGPYPIPLYNDFLKVKDKINGKIQYQRAKLVSRSTSLNRQFCCFCAEIKRFIGNNMGLEVLGCVNQDIITSESQCKAKCESLNSGIDLGASWSPSSYWGKCSNNTNTDMMSYWTNKNMFDLERKDVVISVDSCYYVGEQIEDPKAIEFKMGVGLPFDGFRPGQPITISPETLSQFFAVLYKFFVGLAAILAVFMIAYGGFLWLFSDGAGDKITKAKEVIIAAISGLVLALGSYMLLNFINPALVALDFPNPEKVEPIFVAEDLGKVSFKPSDLPNVFKGDLNTLKATDPGGIYFDTGEIEEMALTPDALAKLKKVEVPNGVVIMITSLSRTYENQERLYKKYIECKNRKSTSSSTSTCIIAADPDKSPPHMLGVAIDACITKVYPDGTQGYSCTYLNPSCNNKTSCVNSQGNKIIHPKYIDRTKKADEIEKQNPGINIYENKNLPALQKELQEIMKKADFTRYCGEWWHFEAKPLSTACEPGK